VEVHSTLEIWPEYGAHLGDVGGARRYELTTSNVGSLGLSPELELDLQILHELATGEGSANLPNHGDVLKAHEEMDDDGLVRWAIDLAVRIQAYLGTGWAVRLSDDWLAR
jgi:hypothetical protein